MGNSEVLVYGEHCAAFEWKHSLLNKDIVGKVESPGTIVACIQHCAQFDMTLFGSRHREEDEILAQGLFVGSALGCLLLNEEFPLPYEDVFADRTIH
jgi:hypothetical protein